MYITKKSKEFVDISLAFEPNPINGDLTVLKNERAINNSIKNIILTRNGEVPFNYNMGSQVMNYIFDPVDIGTAGLLTLEISRAVKLNEPRVEIIDIMVDPQPDREQFALNLTYKIVGYETTYSYEQILRPTRL